MLKDLKVLIAGDFAGKLMFDSETLAIASTKGVCRAGQG